MMECRNGDTLVMAKRDKDSDEGIQKMTEEEQRSSAAVIERLELLVKKGVITGYDLTDAPVLSGSGTVPRIIWTVERLLAEGHLAGVEDAVKGFCYSVGKGMSAQAIKKKRAK